MKHEINKHSLRKYEFVTMSIFDFTDIRIVNLIYVVEIYLKMNRFNIGFTNSVGFRTSYKTLN